MASLLVLIGQLAGFFDLASLLAWMLRSKKCIFFAARVSQTHEGQT